jgi:hypothetical protein
MIAGALACLAVIVRELSKAPEGYEDAHGFHRIVQKAMTESFLGRFSGFVG